MPGLQSFRLEFRISPSHLGAFWPDFSLIQLVEFGGSLARVSHITNTPSCIVDILCFSCIWSALGCLQFSGIRWNFGSDLVVVDGILVVFGCIVSHSVHFLDCSSVVHSYPFHRYTSSMGTPRPLPANAQSFFLTFFSVFLHNFICFFVHFFRG